MSTFNFLRFLDSGTVPFFTWWKVPQFILYCLLTYQGLCIDSSIARSLQWKNGTTSCSNSSRAFFGMSILHILIIFIFLILWIYDRHLRQQQQQRNLNLSFMTFQLKKYWSLHLLSLSLSILISISITLSIFCSHIITTDWEFVLLRNLWIVLVWNLMRRQVAVKHNWHHSSPSPHNRTFGVFVDCVIRVGIHHLLNVRWWVIYFILTSALSKNSHFVSLLGPKDSSSISPSKIFNPLYFVQLSPLTQDNMFHSLNKNSLFIFSRICLFNCSSLTLIFLFNE